MYHNCKEKKECVKLPLPEKTSELILKLNFCFAFHKNFDLYQKKISHLNRWEIFVCDICDLIAKVITILVPTKITSPKN